MNQPQMNAAAPGRPKQGTAPSGGSAVREATSVGALLFITAVARAFPRRHDRAGPAPS